MAAAENKVVLYADILGFAALTKSQPIDLDRLKTHERPLSNLPDFSDLSGLEGINRTPKNPLTDVFSSFHNALKWKLWTVSMWHPITSIAFSDSAFIATTYLHEGVNIAIDLLRSLMSQRTPVRIGIGFGSFAALRFKSDISSDSGDHAAQFLGTAVVHAAEAEKCGIKGLRILLHPSVMPLIEDPQHNPQNAKNTVFSLKCSEKEVENSIGVQQEIDYWNIASTKGALASAWRGLQDMWDKAPATEKHHYQSTAEAIDRMRLAKGQVSLKNLRRRTLPKQN